MLKIYEQIKRLRPFELMTLLENIKLGEGHLKQYLSATQFRQLLAISRLHEGDKKAIKTDTLEKSGNVPLVINGVNTGILGGCLGLFAFMDMTLTSKALFISILVLIIVLSALLGYYSFKFTKSNAHTSVNNLKLHAIQLRILEVMKKKREHYAANLIYDLNQYLSTTNISEEVNTMEFNVLLEQKLFSWLESIETKLRTSKKLSPQNEKLFLKDLEEIKQKIKDLIKESSAKQKETKQSSDEVEKNKAAFSNHKKSFVKLLADPSVCVPQPPAKKPHWLQFNFLQIVVNGIPTFVGCAGSMFVYLGGIPNAVRSTGIATLDHLIGTTTFKTSALIVAILVTVYLFYSFIHINYKAFRRDQELEKIKQDITLHETELNQINEKIRFLKKLMELLHNVTRTVTTFEKIYSHL